MSPFKKKKKKKVSKHKPSKNTAKKIAFAKQARICTHQTEVGGTIGGELTEKVGGVSKKSVIERVSRIGVGGVIERSGMDVVSESSGGTSKLVEVGRVERNFVLWREFMYTVRNLFCVENHC